MNPILEFKQVSGVGREFNLKDVNFSLERGYIMGLSGKNGAGKSTLFRYILNSKMEYKGEILVAGCNIKDNRSALMNQIGFVSEENQFYFSLTAQQNANLLGCLYESWDQEEFLHYMKLFEVSPSKAVSAYSRGEFIKFQVAFAVAHHSKLYLLDEATAGMDPIFRRDFFKIVRKVLEKEDASIVMATHITEEIKYIADFVAILEEGKLLSFEAAC